MPMIPFMEKFPELAASETRSAQVAGQGGLPDGDYGFFELYCNEPGCDCRRVIVTVLREDTGWRRIWATYCLSALLDQCGVDGSVIRVGEGEHGIHILEQPCVAQHGIIWH